MMHEVGRQKFAFAAFGVLSVTTAFCAAYEVNVPPNTTQNGFTDAQKTAIAALTSADEIQKTGGGTLSLSDNFANFEGTIRIKDGVWQVLVPANKSGLGKQNGGDVYVESGATLELSYYAQAASVKNKTLHIAGIGYGSSGGALTSTYNGNTMTAYNLVLEADATICGYSGKHLYCTGLMNMNGHTLTVKNGNQMVAASSIANPGNIICDGLAQINRSCDWPGDADNRVIVTGNAKYQPTSSVVRKCPWTLELRKSITFSTYKCNFSWDGPIELADGIKFTVGGGSEGDEVTLSGPISGAADLAVANSAKGTVVLGGTNTYTGATSLGNGNLVMMTTNAVPNYLTSKVTGQVPTSDMTRSCFAFAGITETNPEGWTSAAAWEFVTNFFGRSSKYAVGSYVAEGERVDLDWDIPSGKNFSAQCFSAIGGGKTVVHADYDDFTPWAMKYGCGGLVYAGKTTARENLWNGFTVQASSSIGFEDVFIALGGYKYWYINGGNTYASMARMTLGNGAIIGRVEGASGVKPIYVGNNTANSYSRLDLKSGSVISNGLYVSGNYFEDGSNFVSAVYLDGGVIGGGGVDVGCNANGIGYMDMTAGAITGSQSFSIGRAVVDNKYAGLATAQLKGGQITTTGNYSFGAYGIYQTLVEGTRFDTPATAYIPISSSDNSSKYYGVGQLAFSGSCRQAFGEMLLGGRISSTGEVVFASGSVVAVKSVTKATKTRNNSAISGSTANVAFNGGGLAATTDGAELLGEGDSAVDSATVYADGAVLEASEGVTAKVSVPLVAPTGKGIAALAFPADAKLTGIHAAPVIKIAGAGKGAFAVAEIDGENEQLTGVIRIINPGCGYVEGETTAVATWGGNSSRPEIALNVTLADAVTTGKVVKRGAGTIELAAANTFGGGVTVEAGTLKISNASALPAGGAVASKGGAIEFAPGVAPSGDFAIDVSGLPYIEGERYVVLTGWTGVTPPTVTGLANGWHVTVRNGVVRISKQNGLVLFVR